MFDCSKLSSRVNHGVWLCRVYIRRSRHRVSPFCALFSFVVSVSNIPVLRSDSLDDLETGEVSQWSLTTETDDDNSNPRLRIEVLLQYVDAEAVRLSIADPYAVYSPNQYSVRAAIKTVADAAATMYVSKLIRSFNSRAARLFKDTVEHMTKKQTKEYIALFGTQGLTDGGFLLLQPVDSMRTNIVTEHCTYPSHRDNSGKRVRVMAFDITPAGTRETFGIVSRRDEAATRRTGAGSFPEVPVIDTTYQIIAGTVDRIGGGEWATLVEALWEVKDLTIDYGVGLGNPPPGGNIDPTLPMLFRKADADTLKGRYAKEEYMFFDYEGIERIVRDKCERQKADYVANVNALITHLQTRGAQGNEDAQQLYTYLINLYAWSVKEPANYIVAFSCPLPNITRWDTNPPGNNGTFGQQLRGTLNVGPGGVLNTTEADIARERPKDMIITAGDLAKALNHDTYDQQTPTDRWVANAGGGNVRDVADPTAITAAYRPIVLNRDNEVRFKMSLLPNSGFNPAFFGGANAVGNLNVDASDERREFDEGIKNWEFNLHVRNLDGYKAEWDATMRTVVQVLVSRATAPREESVPVTNVLNLSRSVPEGIGFVYVPMAPEHLETDPTYLRNIQAPIRPKAQQQFIDSFPRWTASTSVSAAALFWHRNAVATATEPFSIRSQATNMDDVAAMLASSSPFAAMTAEDRKNAQKILNQILTGAHLKFTPDNTLHLIQVTKAAVAPGNSNFSQPFPPLRVQFKSAAIEKADSTRKYQLRYSLGCEATVLVEAMFIVTAMLKVLVKNSNTDLLEMSTARVPPTQTITADFPRDQTDAEYKDSIIRTARTTPFGITKAFQVGDEGQVDLREYTHFIGMWNANEIRTAFARKRRIMNKAGRVVFGPQIAEPIEDATISAPGYYQTQFNDPQNQPMRMGGAGAGGGWDDRLDEFVRGCGLRNSSRLEKIRPNDIRARNLIAEMLKARSRYDDYLFVEMITILEDGQRRLRWGATYQNNGAPLPQFNSYAGILGAGNQFANDHDGQKIPEPYLIRKKANGGPHDAFSLPVYSVVNNRAADLVAFIHIGYSMSFLWDFPTGNIFTDISEARISAIYALQPNVLKLSPENNEVSFSIDVVVGLMLGDGFKNTEGNRINDMFMHGNPLNQNRFIPFFRMTPNLDRTGLIQVSQPDWVRCLDAYDRYKKDPQVVKYKYARLGWKYPNFGGPAPMAPCRNTWDSGSHDNKPPNGVSVDAAMIGKMMRDGFEGYHYGKSDALSTTVFALAAGSMNDKIRNWYTSRDPIMNEPLAVNIVSEDGEGAAGTYDAALITIIQREESKGLSSGAVSSTSGAVLITPLIVEVLGPSEQALSTPCYVDYTYVKTASFRVNEAKVCTPPPLSPVLFRRLTFPYFLQLIGLMYERIDQIKNIAAVKDRVQPCLAEFMIRNRPVQTVRQMIRTRPQVIPTVASLLLQLKTFALISQRTDKGRTTVAVGVAFKEIQADIFKALFKT